MEDLLDPGVLSNGVVELRPWAEDDVDAVCAGLDLSDRDASVWVGRQQARPLRVGVSRAIARIAGPTVGYIGLIRRPRVEDGVIRAERAGELVFGAHELIVGIGYWVIPTARGSGLASQATELISKWALDCAGITRVEALLDPANIASRRVVEKCRFVCEGRLRGYLRLEGQSTDALIYSLLATNPRRVASA